MILLLDNYDSFSYNLYQLLGKFDENILVVRNDKITIKEIEELNPDSIFLSPGPGKPEDAGICIEVIKKFYNTIPILGVCLGHQAIAVALGGTVSYARSVMHGVSDKAYIEEDDPLFSGLGKEILVGRYHSLAITSLSRKLKVLARSGDGEIMAVRVKSTLTYGLQFHPESILTPEGEKIIGNYFDEIKEIKKND